MFDICIVGGDIIDGRGGARQRADVGINGDRITAIGDLSRAESHLKIEADGQIVCPGFIDAHSHSDTYILLEPSADSKLFQGVTTEIVGNCGASAAPRTGAYQMPADWAAQTYPCTWATVSEYRAALAAVGPAVNIRLLIGHNSLRAGVMGYDDRLASPAERSQMAGLLERCLDEGAAGLSTGLAYPPGIFASAGEIEELASVVARYGGVYTSHMRSESDKLLASIGETIDVARRTGVSVQISHLKVGGRHNWYLCESALKLIHDALREGIDIAADRYPYTASCTDMDILLPEWAVAGGRTEILQRVRTPETRQRIRDDISRARSESYWHDVMVGNTEHSDNRRFRGMRMDAVANILGMDPVDAMLHLIDSDELQTGGIFFGMSEENMWRILAETWVMIGSDSSIRALAGPLSLDFPHPRTYGAFVRFLRAAIDEKTVSLPEAIRKMTSLPAERFCLGCRGVVKTGYYADIVVVNPNEVCEVSTFAVPHSLASGISVVIVNGVLTLHDGKLTGERAGIFLAQ